MSTNLKSQASENGSVSYLLKIKYNVCKFSLASVWLMLAELMEYLMVCNLLAVKSCFTSVEENLGMILTDDLIPDSPTSMAKQQPRNDMRVQNTYLIIYYNTYHT